MRIDDRHNDVLTARYRYDELHPSEQADRQVAKFVAGAINRKPISDKWVTWLT